MSDDGRAGLAIIAFVGSVFSPYYAWARARSAAADPANHCAVNVALYGPRGDRWAMTERGRAATRRAAQRLQIGPSAIVQQGDALVIHIDEITAPWPSRLRGVVRVACEPSEERSFALDAEARHRWHPIAPRARVEVEFEAPALRWAGSGYFDSNSGERPLEDDFVRWDWSRARLSGHRSVVLYDVIRRDGTALDLSLDFEPARGPREFVAPPPVALPASRWGIARGTRSDAGTTPRILRVLEDSPFYARSLVEAQLLGQPVVAMHESLSLDRFRAGWVQALLPFRMPRRG